MIGRNHLTDNLRKVHVQLLLSNLRQELLAYRKIEQSVLSIISNCSRRYQLLRFGTGERIDRFGKFHISEIFQFPVAKSERSVVIEIEVIQTAGIHHRNHGTGHHKQEIDSDRLLENCGQIHFRYIFGIFPCRSNKNVTVNALRILRLHSGHVSSDQIRLERFFSVPVIVIVACGKGKCRRGNGQQHRCACEKSFHNKVY